MHATDLLASRARLTPRREALLELETGRRFSYAELNARANRAAHWLRGRGVTMGDRVSLLAHNSVETLDLFFGCAKIGAIFAPFNWRLAAAELNVIAEDCAPHVLLIEPAFLDTLADMPAGRRVPHVVPLSQYHAGTAALPVDEPPRLADLTGEETLCILYTSGTTGRPKGAMIPHRQVLWNCINTAVSWGLTQDDVSPIFTPLFHAGGLFAFMTPLLYLGGRLVLARDFDPEASLRVVVDERCTVILGVPTLFQMWRRSAAYAAADFGHVRFFISGGAPCPVELMDAWRQEKGVVFRQGYGLTEVGPNCFTMTDEESVPRSGSVGKPVFHSEMRLVDGTGRDLLPGETGELLIGGPHVTTGYWRNPKATNAALRDGWFHTGDMARRDEDGFYTIVGRFKDMIISGGENVYAAEVEAVFHEHPAVSEAALIGKPDEKWGEVGLMIVVLKPGQSATPAALQAFCRQRLANYKVPKEIRFVDSLPYSPYGKVQKAQLREQHL